MTDQELVKPPDGSTIAKMKMFFNARKQRRKTKISHISEDSQNIGGLLDSSLSLIDQDFHIAEVKKDKGKTKLNSTK